MDERILSRHEAEVDFAYGDIFVRTLAELDHLFAGGIVFRHSQLPERITHDSNPVRAGAGLQFPSERSAGFEPGTSMV